VSIEKKAARGVAWNMATSVVTRVAQLVGTLVLTRFIAPDVYGEVSAATICVLTASQLTTLSFGQYIIAHRSPPSVVFQAAVFHFVFGLVAMIAVILLREPLGRLVEVPGMGRLVPGFALAVMIDRTRLIPERLLVRELRFRAVAVTNSVGDLAFTATALALVTRLGGGAIVAGGIVRSTLTAIIFHSIGPRSEWLVFSRLEGKTLRDLLRYGGPLMIATVSERISSSWDNLLMSRLFGATVLGQYNLAYNLAETPLTYVAERIGDVLMPSFAKMEPGEREGAVIRSAGIMSLLVAPLGVGLGAVAPTVVRAFFDARWAPMGAMLTILSVMTIFVPSSWPAMAYLQIEKRTGFIMIANILRAVVLLASVLALGLLGGIAWACLGVGIGAAFHTAQTIYAAARFTRLSVPKYLWAVVRPLFACVPMFVAVYFLNVVLAAARAPLTLSLALQILCGAVVYVVAAFVLARPIVAEMLSLVRAGQKARAT
jgi:PST family polysaccharide transporter